MKAILHHEDSRAKKIDSEFYEEKVKVEKLMGELLCSLEKTSTDIIQFCESFTKNKDK